MPNRLALIRIINIVHAAKRACMLAPTREYPIRTDVIITNQIKLKLTALNHSANSLLILPRIELEFHFYQKCTLPIKLKNLLKYKYFTLLLASPWPKNEK